jgi:hypothetical protein
LDARSNNPTSVLRRNPEWLEKGVMNFHAILEAPKGVKHPRFGHLPEIENFAKVRKRDQAADVMALFQSDRLPVRFAAGHAPGAREDL